MDTLKFWPALAIIVLVTACREPTAETARPGNPLFSLGSVTSCPNPSIVVTNEADLLAALAGASAGDVIGLDGVIEVAADLSISVEGVTLTCATPGSGLRVAVGATVSSLVKVLAPFVTVNGLTLDGTGAGDPYLALNDPDDIDNDGVTGTASDVRLTNNTVMCSVGDCAFFFATRNAVVSGNEFHSTGSFTGIQLQGGIDGSRVERNTIVATVPSTNPNLGGIRVRDGTGVVVADNVVRGPWANSLAAQNLTGATISGNRVEPDGSARGILLFAMDGVVVDNNTLIGAGGAVEALEIDGSTGVVMSRNAITGSWVDAFVLLNTSGAQIVDNTVTCGSDECVFGSGAPGTVVAGNHFTSGGSGTGIQMQAGTDGVRVENNEIVATTPSGGVNLGGIRVRDGANVVIAGNVVRGPWQNGLALADLADSRIEQNQVDGALQYGIRARSGGSSLPVSMTHDLFRANRITRAGLAGILLTSACGNQLVGNNLQGNAENIGAIFDGPSGANVFVGNATVVIDDALPLDCDGDGAGDPNVISAQGRVLRGVPLAPIPDGAEHGSRVRLR